MLYFDGINLKLLIDELKENLKGRKITKIVQYDKYSLSLFFSRLNLFISVSPKLPICYIQDNKDLAPTAPLKFALSLKKYLQGAIISSAEQINVDRIIKLNFSKIDELGNVKFHSLIIELMGKHSNIFLVDENNIIIDLIKKFSLEENKLRLLMPGATYETPLISEKINPYEIDKTYFNNIYIDSNSIIKNIDGFGKISSNQISSFEDFKNLINAKANPTIYYNNDKPVLASFVHNNNYNDYEKKNFDSISLMINDYIFDTIASNQINSIKTSLKKIVNNKINKNKSALKKIDLIINNEENIIIDKIKADILAANIYNIPKYKEEVTLLNFYDNEDILIKLDPTISAQENLDRYYKKYNKNKRAVQYNKDRKDELTGENEYLNQIIFYIENSKDIDNIKEIEKELIDGRYIKKRAKKGKKEKINKIKPKSIDKDNYTIFYGTNNRENEYITFKLADKEDIWLHVKDIPGSHVIIKNKGDMEINEDILVEAAIVAVKNSAVKSDERVLVDYTKKRYVKKPNGSKPGFVIYTHDQTLVINDLN